MRFQGQGGKTFQCGWCACEGKDVTRAVEVEAIAEGGVACVWLRRQSWVGFALQQKYLYDLLHSGTDRGKPVVSTYSHLRRPSASSTSEMALGQLPVWFAEAGEQHEEN